MTYICLTATNVKKWHQLGLAKDQMFSGGVDCRWGGRALCNDRGLLGVRIIALDSSCLGAWLVVCLFVYLVGSLLFVWFLCLFVCYVLGTGQCGLTVGLLRVRIIALGSTEIRPRSVILVSWLTTKLQMIFSALHCITVYGTVSRLTASVLLVSSALSEIPPPPCVPALTASKAAL